jgi:hypothetical protein
MRKQKQPSKAEANKARQKLQREAAAIARHFGQPIGFDAMYWATEKSEPTAKSFDREGRLTDEARDEFLRVMGENWENIRDNVAHYVCRISRSELNTMRQQQGLPPV